IVWDGVVIGGSFRATLVLAADDKDNRTSRRQRIPCRSVVNHCRSSRWIPAGKIRFWPARQVAVSSYRQVSRLLVCPFQVLHVLGDRRNVDRTSPVVDVRRGCGGVGGQGQRDACYDGARSRPLRDGRRWLSRDGCPDR